MGRSRLGLAVVFTLALAIPGASFAAAPAIPKEARTQGMKDAPALVAQTGADCQVSDARHIGDGQDPKTKVKSSLYEVACGAGVEGLIVQKSGDEVHAFTCLQAAQPGPDGKPNPVSCLLPANAEPKAGMAPYLTASKITCTPDGYHVLGTTPDATYVEVACHDNAGYILKMSNPPKAAAGVQAIPCVAQPESSNLQCVLTNRQAQLAVVDRLAQASGKPCDIKSRGYIGATQDGRVFFEAGCSDGKGWMLIEAANGSLDKAIPCANADIYLGGCKLTNSREAKTEEASLYAGMAKKAGYDCDVGGYAPLPSSPLAPNDEWVELTCKNRPAGGIAVFPATGGGGAVYDCARAEMLGYHCSLTKASLAYDDLTSDLKALGKTSCTVSEARSLGMTPDKRGYMEVGCSDGLPGFMIEYKVPVPAKMAATSVIPCSEAKGIAGGCTLPGNRKG
ncbi:MAG TPA: hypothetical protein VG248_10235 [Caulobacteraceae bacterium]|jgi:hypothetical protein|nr:hypothetical protein [Caulobacteraceae bacterium]